jgi:hypothetical protein
VIVGRFESVPACLGKAMGDSLVGCDISPERTVWYVSNMIILQKLVGFSFGLDVVKQDPPRVL